MNIWQEAWEKQQEEIRKGTFGGYGLLSVSERSQNQQRTVFPECECVAGPWPSTWGRVHWHHIPQYVEENGSDDVYLHRSVQLQVFTYQRFEEIDKARDMGIDVTLLYRNDSDCFRALEVLMRDEEALAQLGPNVIIKCTAPHFAACGPFAGDQSGAFLKKYRHLFGWFQELYIAHAVDLLVCPRLVLQDAKFHNVAYLEEELENYHGSIALLECDATGFVHYLDRARLDVLYVESKNEEKDSYYNDYDYEQRGDEDEVEYYNFAELSKISCNVLVWKSTYRNGVTQAKQIVDSAEAFEVVLDITLHSDSYELAQMSEMEFFAPDVLSIFDLSKFECVKELYVKLSCPGGGYGTEALFAQIISQKLSNMGQLSVFSITSSSSLNDRLIGDLLKALNPPPARDLRISTKAHWYNPYESHPNSAWFHSHPKGRRLMQKHSEFRRLKTLIRTNSALTSFHLQPDSISPLRLDSKIIKYDVNELSEIARDHTSIRRIRQDASVSLRALLLGRARWRPTVMYLTLQQKATELKGY